MRANDDLNARVKTMNSDRAEMTIRIAKLESRPRPGLVYRGEYKRSVDNLNRSVAAMMRADSIGTAVVTKDEFTVKIVLNQGAIKETLFTSDLSYDYIKINAEYRT